MKSSAETCPSPPPLTVRHKHTTSRSSVQAQPNNQSAITTILTPVLLLRLVGKNEGRKTKDSSERAQDLLDQQPDKTPLHKSPLCGSDSEADLHIRADLSKHTRLPEQPAVQQLGARLLSNDCLSKQTHRVRCVVISPAARSVNEGSGGRQSRIPNWSRGVRQLLRQPFHTDTENLRMLRNTVASPEQTSSSHVTFRKLEIFKLDR